MINIRENKKLIDKFLLQLKKDDFIPFQDFLALLKHLERNKILEDLTITENGKNINGLDKIIIRFKAKRMNRFLLDLNDIYEKYGAIQNVSTLQPSFNSLTYDITIRIIKY
ncbi:MAG: hypothetical protein P8Y70_01580 [Candidatus Lokiarchaeota archaeon]